ncbi:lantibiotic immunity ABC transporter MutE/EpiE family permease subunit [Thermoclostridium stercorarium]|uniref:lantibiotic immunity ABC transporter MutE/EpiE family permease subunit n=1 Tax=Thermoclostridium stercorarium TaxID=1510 RepID=UPI002249312D|nr:lantibiotic immunity ABC transporter MutE/EpiE family permease subunit [Thermoclostridium stercorarium]UZQ85724.1 lantibiotic immunity ABC transporter MutE/EpiE family permease subunit [Thermoclostridium stercorarium]
MKKGGNYRSLRMRDISMFHLWIAKIAVMGVHTLISTLVLIVSTVLSGIIAGGGKIPWSQIFAAAFTVWVVSLAIIPLQLWMATWKGTLGSMVMGFTGMITGVLAASEPYWIYVPWSWPTRLMSPIIGVHPNGTLLEPDSPLLDASVIPVGIIVSLITLLIFTCLTAIWFDRREVG